MKAHVSHQVDVDHPLDDVPTLAALLEAVVPPARHDRLQWELRAGLEHGVVPNRPWPTVACLRGIGCPSGGEFVRYLTVIVQEPTAWTSKN